MKVLAIGPYIGSMEEELLTFRPYARWLTEVVDYDKVYISTHSNRFFLYNFIPNDNLISVFHNFSRDEKNQKGYIYKKVNKKDFNLLIRKFKEDVTEREGCSKKDIENHFISYTKNKNPYSIYKKIFEKIPRPNIKIPKENKNRVIFIPSRKERWNRLNSIYKHLKTWYNPLVIGDSMCYFVKSNYVLNELDYFKNGWKYIIEHIMEAKTIICPISYWTAIANLQNKKVFSWGRNPGQYREGGIYYFGNENNHIIPSDPKTENEKIIKSIDYFLEG